MQLKDKLLVGAVLLVGSTLMEGYRLEEDEAEVVKDHRLGRGIVGETGTAKF